MLEALNQPIDVITVFAEGKLRPLRFKWRNRVVKVSKVTGEWLRDEGIGPVRYYAVLADNSDYFELAYDIEKTRWRLCRVWMDG